MESNRSISGFKIFLSVAKRSRIWSHKILTTRLLRAIYQGIVCNRYTTEIKHRLPFDKLEYNQKIFLKKEGI